MKELCTIITLTLCLFLQACKEDLFDKTDYDAVRLTAVDVSPTGAVLRLNVSSEAQYDTLKLLMDEKQIKIRHTSNHDTLLFVDQLRANQRYYFKALAVESGGAALPSRPLSVTTMDTTTHDLKWRVDTFGVAISNYLKDVAVVDSLHIYAVGHFYMNDSSGQYDPVAYSLAQFDGVSWKPRHLYYSHSGYRFPLVEADGIYVFGPHDIWLASGSVFHWDGTSSDVDLSFSRLLLTDRYGTIDKLWGSSAENIYGVGGKGSIVHFDGQSWQQMTSGTDIHLEDVWGSKAGKVVWVCGGDDLARSILLELQGGSWKTIWNREDPTPPYVYDYRLSTLWSSGDSEFLLTGSSGWIFHHSMLDFTRLYREYSVQLRNYPYRLRGSGKSNVFVVGDYAMIWHFNGATWHEYDELRNESDRLYGLAVEDRTVVAVGSRGPYEKALVLIGTK